jgi:hypothetical protein
MVSGGLRKSEAIAYQADFRTVIGGDIDSFGSDPMIAVRLTTSTSPSITSGAEGFHHATKSTVACSEVITST